MNCPYCEGEGAIEFDGDQGHWRTCDYCDGKGQIDPCDVTESLECEICKGTGGSNNDPCSNCGGKGTI